MNDKGRGHRHIAHWELSREPEASQARTEPRKRHNAPRNQGIHRTNAAQPALGPKLQDRYQMRKLTPLNSNYPPFHLRQPQQRVLVAHDQVAAEEQLDAAAERVPVDGRDGRLGRREAPRERAEAVDVARDGLGLRDRVPLGLVGVPRLEIGAGAEGAACACDDDDPASDKR